MKKEGVILKGGCQDEVSKEDGEERGKGVRGLLGRCIDI